MADDEFLSLARLREWASLNAPSGGCEPVAEHLLRWAETLSVPGVSFESALDRMGNVRVVRRPLSPSVRLPSVTVTAPMDESFLFITHIDDKGELAFESVGFAPESLLGKPVAVGLKGQPGVIGYPAIHLQERLSLTDKALSDSDLTLDMGFRKKAEAAACVRPGDCALFPTPIDETASVFRGKALDTRLLLLTVLQLLAAPDLSNPLTAVFTSVSKSYPWSASSLAASSPGDYRIVLQSFDAVDLPPPPAERFSPFPKTPVLQLGSGPVLHLMDASYLADRALFRIFLQAAEETSIPYQVCDSAGERGEAGMWQRSGEGQRVVSAGLPVRYRSSPCQVASKADCRLLFQWLKETLSRLPFENSFVR